MGSRCETRLSMAVLLMGLLACAALPQKGEDPGGSRQEKPAPPKPRKESDDPTLSSMAREAAGQLKRILEDIRSADGHRYGARDDRGDVLDTLKVIWDPKEKYVGVYHSRRQGVFRVKVATSSDLLEWRWRADLDDHASQPTVARIGGIGYVVAYEKEKEGRSWLRFRHYRDLAALLQGKVRQGFDAPRSLSALAEGTPNIYGAEIGKGMEETTLDVGFHYFSEGGVDRQGRGTLEGFSTWTPRREPALDSPLEKLGVRGNIGDRDHGRYQGVGISLVEGQTGKGDWASWRVYLYAWDAREMIPLQPRTHGGSRAFANPTFSYLPSPRGRPSILATFFIPAEGAAPGEAGQLIFYREI